MVEFWANRIEFNLERLEEVPNRLKDKVKIYIEERGRGNNDKIY